MQFKTEDVKINLRFFWKIRATEGECGTVRKMHKLVQFSSNFLEKQTENSRERDLQV